MDSVTVSSALISPTSDKGLTPAMVTALWVIGEELDRLRVPATAKDAIWLEIPSRNLRGRDGRDDNVWLRKCLDRLTGLKINGEYRGDPWGAVMVAEWQIMQGGSIVRLLIPPSAINAIRAPKTFAEIEYHAAYRLNGPARRLYAALADKKRMIAHPYWEYDLDELRAVLGVESKKSYERWNNFRQWVLDPALKEINDYGTVTVTMTPKKLGRAITAVRFDWKWKSLDEARITEEENAQPKEARHMDRTESEAPPLTDEERRKKIRDEQFKAWSEKNPGSSFVDFMHSAEYRQLRSEFT
jgi:Initiator Rep protein, WH2